MSEPREKTADEVRDEFLDHLAGLVRYWHDAAPRESCIERMVGLVHSLLVVLDGDSAALPAFLVVPCPHPDDKAYLRAEGEDWYPEAPDEAEKAALEGGLHESWYPALVRMGMAYRDEQGVYRLVSA